MSNQSFPRRLLDDAIDRAVHELVQADPGPGFRRRVISKLNSPVTRTTWRPIWLVPVGALAAIVLLAVWLRPGTPSPAAPTQTHIVAQAPVVPPPVAPLAQAPVRSEPVRKTLAAREPVVQFTFGPRTDRVAATSVPAVTEGDAPLPPPAATTESATALAPLQIGPLQSPAPITLAPIVIRPIVLVPQK